MWITTTIYYIHFKFRLSSLLSIKICTRSTFKSLDFATIINLIKYEFCFHALCRCFVYLERQGTSCHSYAWLGNGSTAWWTSGPPLGSGALVRVPPFSPILFLIGPAGFEFPASSSSSFCSSLVTSHVLDRVPLTSHVLGRDLLTWGMPIWFFLSLYGKVMFQSTFCNPTFACFRASYYIFSLNPGLYLSF